MEWHAIIGFISGILQVIAIVPYIKDTLKGTTRPNVVSQSLWTVLQIITVAAQFAAGASWSVIFLIAMTLNTCAVVFLCFRGYGYKKYGWFDYFCLVAAIASIVVWQVTQNPIWALIIAVTANLFATLPTVVKAYKEPKTENAKAWTIMLIASALGLASSTIWNVQNILFPIYFMGESGLIAGLAFFGQRGKKKL
jgi:hypothetical protein